MKQAERVLEYLQSHKSITSLDAIRRFGITRLADVIFRLRKRGYVIRTDTVYGKNRYGENTRFASYRLEEE